MNKQLVIKNILALVLLVVSSMIIPVDGETSQNENVSSRSPAQEFNLLDLNGDATQLSDHRGSVVVLLFWTTW